MKAIWNGTVLAESDETVFLDNTHYFPPDSLNRDLVVESDKTTDCHWKGTASYYDVVVGDEKNADAVWYYANPMEKAASIKGYFAFWKGVEVVE